MSAHLAAEDQHHRGYLQPKPRADQTPTDVLRTTRSALSSVTLCRELLASSTSSFMVDRW